MSSTFLWVGLSLGAGCGAVMRFLLDGAVSRAVPTSLPIGTMAVNLTGAFALGVINGAALPHAAMFVFGTGMVGAYTTFSTWMFETQRLAEERQAGRAAQNIYLSVVLGLAVGAAGLWIGGRL
ncbi:MAG: fluoride efflux transporter CrcB [Nocardioides sp.]|nr:fluoride efflux transporter CrcB [Nocardioides sp.]